jgi:sugar phosphate isomerase/epimerase
MAAPAKARMRSALCAYSFREELKSGALKYDDLVRMAVDLNLDGLDLTVYWFPNTSDEFLLPLKLLAYRSGVEIYSISVRTEMTQATAAGKQKEVEALKGWIDVAARLGAGHIRVFGGRVPKDATEEQAAAMVVDVLTAAEGYAAAKGVILGLENHGGITEKADTIAAIVRKVNSPWVAVNLDTGNFTSRVYEQIESLIPLAANVQVKVEIREDGKRQPQDWERIVKMLAAGGYRGYLALEYEAKEPAPVAVPKLIPKLQSIIRKYGV